MKHCAVLFCIMLFAIIGCSSDEETPTSPGGNNSGDSIFWSDCGNNGKWTTSGSDCMCGRIILNIAVVFMV